MSSDELNIFNIGASGRVVVVAPHPDDEVFAVGGMMALLSEYGHEVDVIAVTDGEASHAASSRITPEQLRTVRQEETSAAYRELGIRPNRFRLGLPDSRVAAYSYVLELMLQMRFAGASVVFAPIATDGHPDHESTGGVAARVAEAMGIPCWQFAVWGWLRPDLLPEAEPERVGLTETIVSRKRRASRCYSSQLLALGPNSKDGPVLPADFLSHFDRDEEFLWLHH